MGFRYFARRQAALLGVGGYVRNLADGRVEVYAIGTASQLRSIAADLARGPGAAAVERVEEEDADVIHGRAGFFSIEPGA